MSRYVWSMAALLLFGCAGQKDAQRQDEPAAEPEQAPEQESPATMPEGGEPQARRGDMAGMCPAAVANTSVETMETPDGMAMTFTTDPANVDELRRRVRMLAEHHGRDGMAMEGMGTGSPEGSDVRAGMEEPGMKSGQMGTKKMAMGPPAMARVENVDRGARMMLTPRDPADLEKLRAHVREHAQMMKSGECPMMQGGQGMEGQG